MLEQTVFKPATGNETVHSESTGTRLVNFATLKNPIVKGTKFPHYNIHKYIWTLPDGITHNQIDNVLVDKRRESIIIDIHSLTRANCDTDHYLVVAVI